MIDVHEGQCGKCAHFGEGESQDQQKIVQIRISGRAEEDLVEPCGHPDHAELDLQVTPISGCKGYTPATAA